MSTSTLPKVSEAPEILWIELTSKCPFKCVFCSRQLLRGKGEHMDIRVYRKLVSELVAPQIVRLNYSGESIHYPHLIEAIELAKQKGARVELVSAFSSIKPRMIEPLVRSGLDLLCISIHAVEPGKYKEVYGFGSYDTLLQRLRQLRETQSRLNISTPRLEFALVAMERNLDQIPAVMELAERLDVSRLDIHPVIRRDPIAETFPVELDDSNSLRQGFIERLSGHVQGAKQNHPGIITGFSTPEIEPAEGLLGEEAIAWPGQLPPGARILSCEQNPWNTTHVLANGDVVTCEVHDQTPIGNLAESAMRSIWRGKEYQRFRHDFVNGRNPKCNTCAYKTAYLPGQDVQPTLPPTQETEQSPNRSLSQAKTLIARAATATLKLSLSIAEKSGSLSRQTLQIGRHRHPPRKVTKEGNGISVIIPERDSPNLLRQCLLSLDQAIDSCDGDYEVIVVVNGAGSETYTAIRNEFPKLRWHFETNWLGFAAAVQHGLKLARHDWVFLLNTDMQLEREALQEVYQHRASHIFAIACQIFMQDKSRRREETGFTGLKTTEGLRGLYDGDPFIDHLASTHLYAGGGASLFQKNLLSKLIRPQDFYEPFYWEDVDWGFRAQQLGYQVLYVPQARAHHQHRATVSRFFTEQEIDGMFECNALLTGLSFNWYQPPVSILSMRLAQYRHRVFRPSRLWGMLKKRYDTGRALAPPRFSDEEVVVFYPRKPETCDTRPWLLLVSPYLVFPVAHGGAVRIDGISRELARYYRLVLVCDEGWAFDPGNADKLDQFEAVHLLRKPRDDMPNDRLARMKGHARPLLCQEVDRALSVYRPSVVQIEFEELCDLVKLKRDEHWYITLHDVYRHDKHADRYLDQRLGKFDAVFCCSEEDQQLLPMKCQLVENGTRLSQFGSIRPSSGQTLLFTGPFRYEHNRTGMQMFVEEVFGTLTSRFPQLKLRVLCGDEGVAYSNQAPFKHPNIELLPHSDTVARHLETATITINPLRDTAGSCLKTIESMAANRVCVSTPDATRGLKHHGFPALLTAGSAEEFVEIISALLADEHLRHHLERSPPELISNFDWSKRTAQQVMAYEA